MDDEDEGGYDERPPPDRGYGYHGGTSPREKKYFDWLVMSAIAGLCWIVWNIKETQGAQAQSIAVLQTLQLAQSEQMRDTRAYLERRIDAAEGRVLRGVHDFGATADAIKPQP